MKHHDDHEEYEDVISYYKKNFAGLPIFRFICTHPHHDHICGLHKLFADNDIEILNFWDVIHNFIPENFDDHTWHKTDWQYYQSARKGQFPKVINATRETIPFPFWDYTEDRITVLSPSLSMIKDAHKMKQDGSVRQPHEVEIDDLAYALLLQIGKSKIIFAGDGKEKVWNDIYENCGHLIAECAALKGGHHGQESGYHAEAVKLMNPKNIIVSNSREADAENGAIHLYKKIVPNANIYSTFQKGTIIANFDYEGNVKFL